MIEFGVLLEKWQSSYCHVKYVPNDSIKQTNSNKLCRWLKETEGKGEKVDQPWMSAIVINDEVSIEWWTISEK